MFSQSFICKPQKKEIKVTVIFPEEQDAKTEQEFVGYLKELYLKKFKDNYPQSPYRFALSYDNAAKKGGS